MSIDWSMIASIFSSLAGIAASATAAYLGKLRYLAYRRRNEAILEAKKRGDTELVKSLSDIPPPVPAFIPPILIAFGIGGTMFGYAQSKPPVITAAAPAQGDMKSIDSDQYFTSSTEEAEAKKCCGGGCEPGSSCNPKTCSCEAVAKQPEKKPEPKRIDSVLVSTPMPLDARLSEAIFWEPRDCKLNDCYL